MSVKILRKLVSWILASFFSAIPSCFSKQKLEHWKGFYDGISEQFPVSCSDECLCNQKLKFAGVFSSIFIYKKKKHLICGENVINKQIQMLVPDLSIDMEHFDFQAISISYGNETFQFRK